MSLKIKDYIEKKFPKEIILNNTTNENDLWYYENQKADAISAYYNIKPFLKKNTNILEVGGGIHFLSNYLAYLNYNVTSLEPGGFRNEIDKIRNKILVKKEKNLQIKNVTAEQFIIESQKKFDFIFSVNVLEHTKNIKKHLVTNKSLLKDQESICYVRCPNYSFPFESHFYLFFIPYFPKMTFRIFYEKKLIKKFGSKTYFSTIKSINFDCSFLKVKRFKLNIIFLNPIKDILDRIDKDKFFRKRMFDNKLIFFIYRILEIFKLKKILSIISPISIFPYMIFILRKD